MKKTITTLILAGLAVFGTTAFIQISSNGIAGYSGSPGEGTCNNCHGGGSSAASGITITSVPAFSVNANLENEYLPDSTYDITIEVEALTYDRYGFAAQILNPSNTNAGTLQNAGNGVQFLNVGAKRTAAHTAPKITSGTPASFTFKWVAPSSGNATIYAIGNAVNGNGGTSGDFVLSPVNLALVAAPTPTVGGDTSTVGLARVAANPIAQVSVFPNPSSGLSNISYSLKKSGDVKIELIDLKGVSVRQLYQQRETTGYHSQILNISGVASGVYFIKLSVDGEKASQKLITLQ